MKPTYSRVSRYGLVAFASSFDCIGPITRSVYDNALILGAISGKDQRDATSSDLPCEGLISSIGESVNDLKIGLPRELFGDNISPEVKAAVMNAAVAYEKLGARIIDISIKSLGDAVAAYYIVSSAEASSNLARFDGVRYGSRDQCAKSIEEVYTRSRSKGFGDEVRRRIMLGTFALSSGSYDEYYMRAKSACNLVRTEILSALNICDVILSPTAPTTAYKLGIKRDDPTEIWADDLCTVPANVSGLPALTLPCGVDTSGMPIGVQLMGKDFSEPLLYRLGYALEAERSVSK
jgi:aspartyl-tRNA(Asn)/glutamyl-tRNA(Gln) amidotransferase subunit A